MHLAFGESKNPADVTITHQVEDCRLSISRLKGFPDPQNSQILAQGDREHSGIAQEAYVEVVSKARLELEAGFQPSLARFCQNRDE